METKNIQTNGLTNTQFRNVIDILGKANYIQLARIKLLAENPMHKSIVTNSKRVEA